MSHSLRVIDQLQLEVELDAHSQPWVMSDSYALGCHPVGCRRGLHTAAPRSIGAGSVEVDTYMGHRFPK
jgi:hypothetical protein